LNAHAKAWPLEAKPIADSASSFSGKPRSPLPARTFIPVGYISLNADSGDFGLKASYEIAFFYVLAVLQGGGLGRPAIDDAERMGTSEPLCAKSLWLCTTSYVQQDPVSLSKKGDVCIVLLH
jgi:hypothetical protein